jgi:hypothetical protein
MAALSSEIVNVCTFGVDGSSSVGVEKVEGLLDFEDFLLGESWLFEGLGIELL